MSGSREIREHRLQVNGLELCVFEWPGDSPPVFMSHATGFHARCWDQVAERLPGVHCFAIDMRGHGRSEKPADPAAYNWMNFGKDIAEVTSQLGISGALGIGHSKGGHALVTSFPRVPGTFAGLLLLDPVLQPRETYRPNPTQAGEHFAARRRNEWSSVEEMRDRFASRPPFSGWDPLVLQDYCEFGLLPAPSGEGFVLACPPVIEAATYAGSAGADPYPSIEQVDVPVRVIRARPKVPGASVDMSASFTAEDVASKFAKGMDYFDPQLTHFIPMEAPDLVADHVREMLAAIRAARA